MGEWSDQYLDLEESKINFGILEASTEVVGSSAFTPHHHHFSNSFGELVRIPESVCSRPCGVGESKIAQAGDKCCWICTPCRPYEYVFNESQCLDCGEGRWPWPDKVSCFDLELRYMKWDSPYALIAISVSVLGMALTAFVVTIFFRYSETPIVKASGRELSFILLSGILFCFLNTFILLAKPTLFSCSLQRFGVRFWLLISY